MRIISLDLVDTFLKKRPQAQKALSYWLDLIRAKAWSTPAEVKSEIRTVDTVAGKMVFNVGGNKYRVICKMGFNTKTVLILFVGTHKEYDKIDLTKF